MCAFVRHAHQFRPSAHGHRIGQAIEAPQGILVCRAIVFFWKVGLSLTDTKARWSERIDKATASDSVQGRNVHPSTRGHEILVSFASDGNLNKALAKRLKQLLVGSVVAIVTRRTASNQKRSHGDGGCTLKFRVARNHPLMMPPIVATTTIEATSSGQGPPPDMLGLH